LTQYRLVTDRQTDRHVAIAKTSAGTASRGSQESPAIADKPARWETMPKIAAVRP